MTPDKAKHNRSEKKMTAALAKRQPVSGAIAGMRGDIIHGDVLIDQKDKVQGTTQFTVTVDQIEKVRTEAAMQGQIIGCVLVNMMKTGRRYYVIDADDLERIADDREERNATTTTTRGENGA